ncbi:MAG: hypothetical protein M3R00_00570 [Pseudomonadota bacterium]|nr:hypothetical protein [Pseudomonadota bacterium]
MRKTTNYEAIVNNAPLMRALEKARNRDGYYGPNLLVESVQKYFKLALPDDRAKMAAVLAALNLHNRAQGQTPDLAQLIEVEQKLIQAFKPDTLNVIMSQVEKNIAPTPHHRPPPPSWPPGAPPNAPRAAPREPTKQELALQNFDAKLNEFVSAKNWRSFVDKNKQAQTNQKSRDLFIAEIATELGLNKLTEILSTTKDPYKNRVAVSAIEALQKKYAILEDLDPGNSPVIRSKIDRAKSAIDLTIAELATEAKIDDTKLESILSSRTEEPKLSRGSSKD